VDGFTLGFVQSIDDQVQKGCDKFLDEEDYFLSYSAEISVFDSN
jgi:hypothetical protein